MKTMNVNTNGNRKLQNTDTIRYMIWNLPAVKTCPFRTEMCEKSCYARKAERIYPQVLPAREKNYSDSLENEFVENMIYTIEKYLNSKAFSGKKCVFRIHESGDFYSVEYAEKWVEIAKHFTNDDRIVFLAYTKSITFFDFTALPENLVARSSIWKDTAPDKIEFTAKNNIPIYTAGTEMEVVQMKNNGFRVCKCENCSNCKMCWNKNIKNITCKIH